MSTVINGPVLGTAGVGKFHEDIGSTGRVGCTTLNVVGWIPVASIVSGAIRSVVGARIIANSTSQSKKMLGKAWVARGITEMCCVGIVLAPLDIGCSAARMVEEKPNRPY
jgi:hypothetical protein